MAKTLPWPNSTRNSTSKQRLFELDQTHLEDNDHVKIGQVAAHAFQADAGHLGDGYNCEKCASEVLYKLHQQAGDCGRDEGRSAEGVALETQLPNGRFKLQVQVTAVLVTADSAALAKQQCKGRFAKGGTGKAQLPAGHLKLQIQGHAVL